MSLEEQVVNFSRKSETKKLFQALVGYRLPEVMKKKLRGNIKFCGVNEQMQQFQYHSRVGLSGVNDTAELDSAGSRTQRSWTQRGQWHSGVGLSGVNDTAKLDSAGSMTQRSWTQQGQWHYGVNDTAEVDSAESMTLRRWTQRSQWHRGGGLCRVNDFAEFDSAECQHG